MAKALTKQQILEASDLKKEKVEVPEWGGYVFVRTLTGAEFDQYERSIIEGRKVNLSNVRAKLASRTIVDDDGKRLFTEAEAKALGGKSAKALDRVYDVAARLNGVGPKDVEELVKNSGKTQASGLSSS